MAQFTSSLESATRKKIDLILNNLGWNTDESSKDCNVFTERAKTIEQNKKLEGKRPDYLLYKSGTSEIIAVLEVKRKGQSIDNAIKQAMELYVYPLNVPLVFATDGSLFKSYHCGEKKELTVDRQIATELFPERKMLRFISEGSDISEASLQVKHTREELIKIFKWTNDLLRKEGLREGIERFTEFANILFLKLISELENDKQKNGEMRLLDDKYCWKSFADLDAIRMLEYVNGTILPHLVKEYNHTGEVFQTKLAIKNPETLKRIVDKLSDLELINVDSDVKGDAFEYFLKNSVTIGNDLGEYFTPRHIVRLMVGLINPQFGEKVYDPTCGTGGFIIEAFRHIKKSCKMTKETMKVLSEDTIYAKEITNTAKIAKMNMILAGDGHTNIKQEDALENPVKNVYDVVLANIPYGQTTDWGNLYDIPSNQADCVFIQHILQSLNGNGRVGVIAPEGFLFRKGKDRDTRIAIVTKYNLVSVISLPEGVFLPYTPSKTNILIIEAGSRTESVWFYDLKADGFELSKTRKPIPENDVGDLISKWSEKLTSENSWTADVKTIAENGYSLQAKRYKTPSNMIKENIPFSAFLKPTKEKLTIDDSITYKQITVQYYGKGAILRQEIKGEDIETKDQFLAKKGQLIFSKIDAKNGAIAIVPEELDGAIVTSDFPLFDVDTDIIDLDYLDCFIRYYDFRSVASQASKGTTNRKRVVIDDILDFTLPLPSKDIQREYVERLYKQRNIISSLENSLQSLKEGFIDDISFEKLNNIEWKKLVDITTKSQYGATQEVLPAIKGTPLIRITDIDSFGRINYKNLPQIEIPEEEIEKYVLSEGDLLIARSGSIGKCAVFDGGEKTKVIFASYLIRFIVDKKKVLPKFVLYYLLSHKGQREMQIRSKKMVQANINAQEIGTISIPLVPFEEQEKLISTVLDKLNLIAELEKTKATTEDTINQIVKTLFSL